MNSSVQRSIPAYVSTPDAEDLVRRASAELGLDRLAVHRGSLATAARLAGRAANGETIIAELGEMSPQDAAESLRTLAEGQSRVILLGQRNDVTLYRQLIAAGAQDYMVLPVEPPDLVAALSRQSAVAAQPEQQAHVIGVTSIRGGGGASFAAANLAWLLAERMACQTVLVDLDLGFGTQAVDFDVPPTTGLIEALMSPDRVDETYLSATLATVGEKLRLYSAEGPIGQDYPELPENAAQLVAQLSKSEQAVVLDLPRGVAVETPDIAARCKDLVVMVSPAISVARTYGRFRQRMEEIAPETRLHPVLSMNRTDARLTRKEVEGVLGEPLAAVIPNAAAAIARAAVAGKPLGALQARSPAVLPLHKLLTKMIGEAPTQRTFFRWRRS